MKKLNYLLSAWMLVMVTVLCLSSAQAANRYQDETGTYDVTVETRTGPDNEFYIYRPATLVGDHPVIVFCVGTFAKPWWYAFMLKSYASHGVVVIAGTDRFQLEGDQALKGMNWLLDESPYRTMLDQDRVMAMGHSQGGYACMRLWEKAKNRICAILPMMPGNGSGIGGDPVQYGEITAPIFFITGEEDDGQTTSAALVLSAYNQTAETYQTPAWFGSKADTAHYPGVLKEDLHLMVRAFMYAQLMDDPEARDVFYVDGTDDNFLTGDWAEEHRKYVD